jgi:recombination protein RecR
MGLPKEIQGLAELLSSLPNIGPKLSTRLALFLSTNGKGLGRKLGTSIEDVIAKITVCSICSNITTSNICEICADDSRDKSLIIVVEDSLDLYNIEAASDFHGYYQVLGGVISPINGIGPNDIKILQLINRVKLGHITEVVLALNPNLEGDSTSLYIKNEIEQINAEIKVTRIAKGIPVGGDIEFASSQTIIDSLKSRSSF